MLRRPDDVKGWRKPKEKKDEPVAKNTEPDELAKKPEAHVEKAPVAGDKKPKRTPPKRKPKAAE